MKVCLLQTDIFWEQKEANMASIEEKLSDVEHIDWLILPEMFTTGFSVSTKSLAEHVETNTFKWMKQQAQRYDAVVSGSFITKGSEGVRNTLLSVSPKGVLNEYNKKNLFTYGGEGNIFSPGDSKQTFRVKEFDCLGLICYDLRFPEWSRYGKPTYDVLFYVANWPKPRIEQWTALLKARAIENQCYVIGVNRIGVDGTGLEYNGHSVVFDCTGKELASLGDQEKVQIVNLDLELLKEYRKKIPFLNDIK